MKHFRTPVFDADGLCEEDRIAIAMDEAADITPGECDENGVCLKNCGRIIPTMWCRHCAMEWTGEPC